MLASSAWQHHISFMFLPDCLQSLAHGRKNLVSKDAKFLHSHGFLEFLDKGNIDFSRNYFHPSNCKLDDLHFLDLTKNRC
uniref:Zinc finger HIT domain-containing protein 3 n=1 Tax=Rhizophora mucronata TaxID=61149 RepID=A0A2P2JZR5_RHIMU